MDSGIVCSYSMLDVGTAGPFDVRLQHTLAPGLMNCKITIQAIIKVFVFSIP